MFVRHAKQAVASANSTELSRWVVWTPDGTVSQRIERELAPVQVLPSDVGHALLVEGGRHTRAAIAAIAGGAMLGCVEVDGSPAPALQLNEATARAMGLARSGVRPGSRLVDAFLAAPELEIAYQPIVSLTTGLAVSYELLARPAIAPIAELVRAAIVSDRAVEVDLALIEGVLARSAERAQLAPFGINVLPSTLLDDRLSAARLRELVLRAGSKPERVTVECTEQQAIAQPQLLGERIAELRRHGFAVAVDDAGAGHASFSLIARLRPTTIKIDAEIVRDVDRDGAQQALVQAFVSFARRIGAQTVAEGIETDGELQELIALGVDLGQGYLLGRPRPTPEPARWAPRLARRGHTLAARGPGDSALDDLARPAVTLPSTTTGEEARTRFVADPELSSIVIVDGDLRPIAGISRDRLMRAFSGPYGWSIYAGRPVTLTGNDRLTVMRAEEPLVAAALQMTARGYDSLYDDLVLVDDAGRVRGVVKMRDLFRAVTELSVREARDGNALTGLPGNRVIRATLEQAAGSGRSVAITHVDLDHFKAFNDSRGFMAGDDLIQRLARGLTQVGATEFLGHVGGDDFIAMWRTVEEAVAGVERVARAWVDDDPGTPSFSAATLAIGPDERATLEAISTRLAALKTVAKRATAGSHAVGSLDPGRPTRVIRTGSRSPSALPTAGTPRVAREIDRRQRLEAASG